jgi:ribosome-associated protein
VSRLVIPWDEVLVRTTRSSGAGGQHVNKTESRVELVWNVQTSPVLTNDQRTRLLTKLAGKLTGDGELRVVASDTRSQYQNREIAQTRLSELVHRALVVPKVRKPTKPTRASKRVRLETKRHRGDQKKNRQRPVDD